MDGFDPACGRKAAATPPAGRLRSLHRFPVPALPFPVPSRNRERIFPVIFTLDSHLIETNLGGKLWTNWFFRAKVREGGALLSLFSPDSREEQGSVPLIREPSAAKNSAGRGRRQGEWETPGRAPGYGFAVEPSVGRKDSAGRGRPVSRPVSGTTQVDSAMTAAAQPDHIAFELKPNRNRASPSPSAAGTDRRACIPPRAPRARASS